jgi:hypothetical protein
LQDSAIPPKILVPWGTGAGANYIRTVPVASQIGINNGYASWTDGFVPLNMTLLAAGGIPPFGQDMNGVLNQLSAGLQWQWVGNPSPYDAALSTQIGGYPKGGKTAVSADPTHRWISTVDNNSSNPDTGGANWVKDVTASDFIANLGAAFSTGWQYLPIYPGNAAGLFMQWWTLGLFSGTTSNSLFPLTFPHACIFMLGTIGFNIPSTSNSVGLGVSAISNSQYTVTVATSLPTPSDDWGVSFLAVGY